MREAYMARMSTAMPPRRFKIIFAYLIDIDMPGARLPIYAAAAASVVIHASGDSLTYAFYRG